MRARASPATFRRNLPKVHALAEFCKPAELPEIRGEVSYPKRAEILSKVIPINYYRRKINVKKTAQNGGRKDIL